MNITNYKNIDNGFFEKINLENLTCIEEIIKKVKVQKDDALIEFSKQFKDGDFSSASDFIVSEKEIEEAYKKISPKLLEALKKAIKNVKEFANAQLKSIKELEIKKENSFIGHKIIPLESVLC